MIREPGLAGAALRYLRWLGRLFPLQDCACCGGASHGRLLCGFCRRSLPRCDARLDRAGLAATCGLDALALRYDYRPPLDDWIARYKYRQGLELAPALAALLPAPVLPPPPGRSEPQADRAPGPAAGPWLIAVPGDPGRLRERGYDPLALLAVRYARRHRLVRHPALRLRARPAQAGLGARSRRDNLRGAFSVPALPQAGPVLLLDDVLTTGSTLAALSAAVRDAGANWVGGVVLARTPAPRELRPED